MSDIARDTIEDLFHEAIAGNVEAAELLANLEAGQPEQVIKFHPPVSSELAEIIKRQLRHGADFSNDPI